ncbi:hypothetical protein D9M68_417090 [compost metagenome]
MLEKATTWMRTSPSVVLNSVCPALRTAFSMVFSSVLSMLRLKSRTNTTLKSWPLPSATSATSFTACGVSSSTLMFNVPLTLSPSLSVTW